MTAVKDDAFFDESIVYNGVQFGGSDAAFDSIPASKYDIRADAVYDEAGRSVTHHRFTLEVRCTFFAASEAALATNLQEIRRRLLQPGRQLKLIGSALGFQDLEPDMIFGPKPISFSAPMTHGLRSSDTVWICEFNGPPCRISQSSRLAFSAFNYGTTWVNDFEGKTTRTITGYFTIPEVRTEGVFGDNPGLNRASKPQLQKVADELRKNVNIALPDGMKRITNTWTQSKAKNRMDFSIIDISVPGRSYPPGVSAITNDVVQMATDPLTFSQADITLSATITVAPDRPPSLAGAYFLQMALVRQASMMRAIGRGKKAAVIPTRLVTSAGLFDNARTTSFLMQWRTTGCLQDLFFSGPWDALPNSDYKRWRTSMAGMWNNHGVQLIKADPTEDAVISICDDFNSVTIGKTPAKDPSVNKVTRYAFDCPDITPENSWIDYDVQVSVFRVEHTSVLRRMVSAFAARTGSAVSSAASIGMGIGSAFATKMIIGPKFDSDEETEHIISQNGIPEQYVLLQAKGRRVKFDPVFPLLLTIGKEKARVIPADPAILGGVASRIERKIIAKFGNCEIRQMRGFQWYRVLDHVSDYGTKFNPVVCATTRGNEDKPAV